MARGRSTSMAYVSGLVETRRALRGLGRDAGRELDRAARELAEDVRRDAQDRTPWLSGRARKSIKISTTYRGIAVRSGLEYFGQIEHGRQIWLRRGLPYRANGPGPTSAAGRRGPVEVRQVRLDGNRVVNEARYLRPRLSPINKAAAFRAPVLAREAELLIERLARKYQLT
jgi:hypothetical protein